MPRKWYEGSVIAINDLNERTKQFFVTVQSDENFDFKAGQFVTMDLPIHEKRLKRWRSYSIANAPNDENLLEFCIVRLQGGAGTKYLFEDVKVGDTIKFKGPAGVFYLPDEINKDIVMICTGTGVAPFRGMLLDLFTKKRKHKNIHLIFGTRKEADILYREEFEAFARDVPSFRYDVVLSQAPDWSGYQGYVHQLYQATYTSPREDLGFYLCGWSQMVDEALVNLHEKMGFAKEQIRYELYG